MGNRVGHFLGGLRMRVRAVGMVWVGAKYMYAF